MTPEEMRKSATYVAAHPNEMKRNEVVAWAIQLAAEICERLDRLLDEREED